MLDHLPVDFKRPTAILPSVFVPEAACFSAQWWHVSVANYKHFLILILRTVLYKRNWVTTHARPWMARVLWQKSINSQTQANNTSENDIWEGLRGEGVILSTRSLSLSQCATILNFFYRDLCWAPGRKNYCACVCVCGGDIKHNNVGYNTT